MRPSVLLFDLSEVLISGLVGVECALAPLVGESEAAVLSALGGEPLRGLCRGALTEDEYLARVLVAKGWDVGPAPMKAAIRRNLRRVVPGMPELVANLRGRVGLVLVSDHAREWIEYVESVHPFLRVFDSRVYSFETGRLKDESGAFEEILRRIGAAAEDCLLIDDSVANVEGAKRAGLRAVRFVERISLTDRLAEVGIPVR